MDAFRGIGLVWRTARLRALAAGPMLAALVVFIGLGYAVGTVAVNWLSTAFHLADGTVIPLGKAAFVVLWIALFPFLFTALVGVFLPFVFDHLSRAAEETLAAPGEPIPDTRPSPLALVADTIGRIALNGVLTLAALLLSLFVPALGPAPWVLAAGIISLLDGSAPAFQRRGVLLGGQLRTLLAPPTGSVLAFILVAGVLAVLPFVGVFCLPGLVAGATKLSREMVQRTP